MSRLAQWASLIPVVSAEDLTETQPQGDHSAVGADTKVDVPLEQHLNPLDPQPEVKPEQEVTVFVEGEKVVQPAGFADLYVDDHARLAALASGATPAVEDNNHLLDDHHLAVVQQQTADKGEELDNAITMHAALEQYHALLTEADTQGGISQQAAKFMRLGLEQLEAQFAQPLQLTPGLECFGGPEASRHSTRVSVEALGGAMGHTFKAIQEIWRELRIYLGTLWNELLDGTTKLQKDIEVTAQAASVVKGEPKASSFTVRNAQLAFADGEFVAHNPVVIAGLTAVITQEYPTELRQWLKTLATCCKQLDLRDPLTIDKQLEMVRSMGGPHTSLSRAFNSQSSDVLPGNYTVHKHNTVEAHGSRDKVFASYGGDAFFTVHPPSAHSLGKAKKDAPATYEVPVGTPAEVQKRAADLLKIINALAQSRSFKVDLTRELDDLASAAEALIKRAEATHTPAIAMVRQFTNGCAAVSRTGLGNFNQVYYYLVRVLKTNLSILRREIEMYQ